MERLTINLILLRVYKRHAFLRMTVVILCDHQCQDNYEDDFFAQSQVTANTVVNPLAGHPASESWKWLFC